MLSILLDIFHFAVEQVEHRTFDDWNDNPPFIFNHIVSIQSTKDLITCNY